MRRREFLGVLSGAAASWPLATHAQQPERIRRIGLLMPGTADDPEFQARIGAFLPALALLGWNIGGNVRLEGVGVAPDVPVALDLPYAAGWDTQRVAAVEEMCRMLAGE